LNGAKSLPDFMNIMNQLLRIRILKEMKL